jgi:hypothetical protein
MGRKLIETSPDDQNDMCEKFINLKNLVFYELRAQVKCENRQ